jgi:very-short-patch-repair endonuclease
MPARNIVIGQKVSPEKAQRAKDLRRQMTPEEALLWRQLRTNHLHNFHFRRQQVIEGFIVDFYCHAAGLVVEVDGNIHRQQLEYDRERDRILAARGLRVVRIRNEEVGNDLGNVLTRIASYLTPQPPSLPGKGEEDEGEV